jgi:hypothetical protein
MTTQHQWPTSQEPSFVGNAGNSGNSQCFRGLGAFPLIEMLGNRGNTHLFFNKRRCIGLVWLPLSRDLAQLEVLGTWGLAPPAFIQCGDQTE